MALSNRSAFVCRTSHRNVRNQNSGLGNPGVLVSVLAAHALEVLDRAGGSYFQVLLAKYYSGIPEILL